ncbi:Alpha/Beta hydrolase protein [Mycena epipterygia]|nr:Alpha/Beta hydrolase protein [Mycena epipterygia]
MFETSKILFFWAILINLFNPPVTGTGPIVKLGYATYQGVVDTSSNITTFLGIRYAAPPVGDLRFRAPQPPALIPGVQQTKEQPNQCWQVEIDGLAPTNPFRTRAVTNISSEDCLFLSVYYPSDAQGVPIRGGSLPTIVYIHGGGYFLGSSSQFRGSDLIKQSNHGVVVVIIQYRLGLFGFLAGSAVKNNGTPNAGLLDQDFALRWVNKQIAKFGGDPSKVTIWGESAGAGSVLQHLIANGGQTEPQLFRAAISSSPFVPSQYEYNGRIPELVYSELVALTNCTSASDSLACLRAADVSSLQAANLNMNAATFSGTYPFPPVVDGAFIQQSPTKALAEGLVNGDALLAVTNVHEGTIFVNTSVPASANVSQYALELFPDFGLAQAQQVRELYANVAPLDQAAAVCGDATFKCPTYSLLRAFSGRTFKAEFAIPPGNHGMDLQYYFPSLAIDVPVLNYPTFFNNMRFINAFAQSFTAFAISSDPNIKLSKTVMPLWVRWNTTGRTEMVFNKTVVDEPLVEPVRTKNALLERCLFWDSVGNLTGH